MAGGTRYRSSGGKLVGVDVMLKRLNDKINQIENGTKAGMRTAVLLVKRDSVRQTPVDTTHLRGSAFTEVADAPTKHGVAGVIGYTASYAPFVHEIPKRYKKGRVGFLRAALLSNSLKILKAIKDGAKIK